MKRPEKYVVLEHLTLPDRGLRFWSHNTENNTHSMWGIFGIKKSFLQIAKMKLSKNLGKGGNFLRCMNWKNTIIIN